jgi:hypothetical protein
VLSIGFYPARIAAGDVASLGRAGQSAHETSSARNFVTTGGRTATAADSEKLVAFGLERCE